MSEQSSPPRAILITGAGAGLGEAMARRFDKAGWAVLVADRDEDRARSVADSLGRDSRHLAMDVVEPADWERAVAMVEEQFGKLDVLVNNAGVAVAGTLEETSLEDWRWVIDIDLMGVVMGCKAFAPMLRAQGQGHIVNVASFAGFAGAPGINAYGTAKAGVIALSELLRAELAPAGVEVSVLCPAFVKTRLTETMRAPDDSYSRRVERWMENSGVSPDDVAAVVEEAVGKPRFLLLTHRNTRWIWRFRRFFPERYFRFMMRGIRKASR